MSTPVARVEHPLAPADRWDDDDMTECLTLDELISALACLDPKAVLLNGFRNPMSYRGFYDQLAFEPADGVTVGEALAAARSALGATYTGYKGGEYRMGRDTPCWIASYGDCGRPLRGLALRDGDAVEWHGEKAHVVRARLIAERDALRVQLRELTAERDDLLCRIHVLGQQAKALGPGAMV